MKIITLIENLLNSQELVAEHGLSLYIDTGNEFIRYINSTLCPHLKHIQAKE
jgi:hypothetical protein